MRYANRWMTGLVVLTAMGWIGCQKADEPGPRTRTNNAGLQAAAAAPRASNRPVVQRNLASGISKLPVRARHEPGVVLVKFHPDLSERAVTGVLPALDLRRIQKRSPTGVERLAIDGRETVFEAVARLNRDPRVIYAEPNWEIRLLNVPDDPRYTECWGLHNTGQTGGVEDADIDAQEAWDISIGSFDVVVAVLDTGVDYNHPDLAANMWTNDDEIPGNGEDDDNNGYIDDVRGWDFEHGTNDPMDDYGHGTHCAGTIGAAGNNGVGVAGVNWRVTIMPLRIIGNQDLPTYCLDAAEGIQYAVDNGAHVMSCSWWTVQEYSQTLEDTVAYAEQQGVYLVAAAGNDSTNDDDPGYNHWPSEWPYENIIAVAATDHEDNIAYFSNYGPTTVDVGAPGLDILSCIWPGGGYDTMSGTSMATPHVAGTVALILSIRPDLTVDELRQFLFTTVDPIADLQGQTVTGGRINAHRVLQAISGVPLPPVALAGGDRTVMTGTTVELDGSKSFDPNQDPISYAWDFYPPSHSSAVLSDETAPDPSFVADVCGEYQAFLTVEDDGGLVSEPDRARIHVMNWSDHDPPIETPHPYEDGMDETWIIQQPGAVVISVHFASFDTESGYDVVHVLDANDQEWAVYDGPLGAFSTVLVEGDTVKLHFTSDGSVTRDGFVVDGVWWCDAGRCPPGTGDCDDDPSTGPDGCETDTTDDPDNCGWCGHACIFPHASSICSGGICVIDQCNAGWTDCDGDPLTGCEADLLVDPGNCGSCDNPCGPYDHATPGCAGGSCAIGVCDQGWDDCDGVLANGCEQDVSADVDNCGACNNVCALPHAVGHVCNEGICYPLGACTDEVLDPPVESAHPYEDQFDHTWEIVRVGAAEMAVHFSSFNTERNYDFVYIYDGNDIRHATYNGELEPFWSVSVPGDTIRIRLVTDYSVTREGFVIDQVRACQSGCETNWGNCDGDPQNGCEADLSADMDNCGGCGQMCGMPNTNGQCVDGVCQEGDQCIADWGDCDGDWENGCEADLLADPDNCSACGVACGYDHATGLCLGGTCQMGDCLPGWGDCNASDSDGCETNLVGDPDNCGACGNQCVLPHVDHAYCEDGVCQIGECQVNPQNIETPHPYNDNMDEEWAITHPGASEIQVHFSMFNTESGYDYVRLLDASGVQAAEYTGNLGPFVSDPVSGETLRVAFHSDGSVTRDGFVIDWSRSCTGTGCESGWDDCDGVPGNGCESDVSADPANCGACGQACNFQHGSGDCIDSTCVVASCDADWGDCNGDGIDGCETDLLNDPDHCSACGSACLYDHAAGVCTDGACSMGACEAGFDDCNTDDADGCEVDLQSDPANCGSCGTVCGPYDHAAAGCAAGACVLGACDTGWDDCDGQVDTGCESDVSADPDNCGACGVSCDRPHTADTSCVDNQCVIGSCEDGWGDCDAEPMNGCEVDLASDPDNCGNCGNACTFPNGGGTCQDGACVMTSCATGWADCNADVSDGCEADLRSDPDNCGYCDNACSVEHGTGDCVEGSCVFGGCDDGWEDCNQDLEDGCEVNTAADPDNCGGCGTTCDLVNATAACDQGGCVVASCEEGFGDCDGVAENGCETDLLSSDDHCGGCGDACTPAHANGTCRRGACVIEACDQGYGDCNIDPADGCETDLQTSMEHCGTCRHPCGPGQSCQGGDCVCADNDGDGHGVMPCGDDCDDTSADAYPGNQEACDDQIDNDCDGATDEGCDQEEEEEGETEGGGCGCGTRNGPDAPGTALLWLGLLGLLLLRRR